jgi:hypothetical protein
MSNRKPVPLFDQRPRPRCPVCGETSYSVAGIHPQCAVRRLDSERMKGIRLRVAEGQPKNVELSTDMGPWMRACPACNEAQHARKNACECGHVFAIRPGATQQGEES